MITFKSIVILDLETTSLPVNDHNTTRITELAALGCEIDHLKHSKNLPRVLHKLVLLFNPFKKIDVSATDVTGLSNELLMNVKPFTKEDATALRHFIERLPSPVCIVSHCGSQFDFPILRRTLESLDKNLPNNVYCADTLEAFRNLLPKANYVKKTKYRNFREINEKTPERRKSRPVNIVPGKSSAARELVLDDPRDPEDPRNSEDLFPNDEELSEWVSTQQSSQQLNNPKEEALGVRPKSYKLKDVYYFFFKSYFLNPHRAEDDSIALLSCIIHCKGFWDWLGKNSVIFNSIPPLF